MTNTDDVFVAHPAGEVAGDPALGALCEQCTERLRRGLPFVPSLHLR